MYITTRPTLCYEVWQSNPSTPVVKSTVYKQHTYKGWKPSKVPKNRPLERSLLSRLPREIRGQIYTHLFPPTTTDRKISIGHFNATRLEDNLKKLRLIDRSGTLHREALQLYFRIHTLQFCRRLDFCFAWRTIMHRMRLYGIDLHEEVRQVEICAGAKSDSKAMKRTGRHWELTRDAVRMCVRFLKDCEALSNITICFDVNHLFLEEIKPLLEMDCQSVSFEIDMGDRVERWEVLRDLKQKMKLQADKRLVEGTNADAELNDLRTQIAGLVSLDASVQDLSI